MVLFLFSAHRAHWNQGGGVTTVLLKNLENLRYLQYWTPLNRQKALSQARGKFPYGRNKDFYRIKCVPTVIAIDFEPSSDKVCEYCQKNFTWLIKYLFSASISQKKLAGGLPTRQWGQSRCGKNLKFWYWPVLDVNARRTHQTSQNLQINENREF